MEKHASSSTMIGQIDGLVSRINALEAGSENGKNSDLFGAIRVLAEGQKHCINEIDHLKKAIDLITLELFKVSSRTNSTKDTPSL